jgi:pyruvate-formate lyase-activating enzyme
MVEGNLDTTNLLLGIMAAVSVLQALVLIAAAIMGWRLYSQTMQTVRELEQRQVAPLVARVNTLMTTVDGILVDVKGITSRVGQQTERVNSAISTTIDRVDETADRVKSSMGQRVQRIVGLMQGVRAAVSTIVNGNSRRTEAHP